MKIFYKIIIIIIIILIVFELLVGSYEFSTLCNIFKEKFHGNKYGEMVRQIQRASCGYKPSIPISKYIVYKDEWIGAISKDVLILKGSSTILDCIKDIEVGKQSIKNIGRVQSGSNSMVTNIIPQIKNYQINTITGWSLGAMIGLQISLYIDATTGKKTKNIFFGLPPTASKKYQAYYNSKLYSNTIVYNNDKDPIAYPYTGNNILKTITEYIWGYYHVGKVIVDYPYTDYYKKHLYSPASYHLSYF